MLYQRTTATNKIASLTKRIRAVQGGTSASKTVSILLYLIHLSQSDKVPTITSVVSESFPHLKRGVMRDFISILSEHGYFDDKRWNKTDFIYTFETGSKIEFFSVDQPGKTRGPRRDRLFMNEANNIPLEAFEQLEVRTKEFVIMDWNPSTEFWYYTDIEPKRDDVERIVLTYKDNEALDENIIRSIESRRNNKSWWRVYGEGQLGEVEGRIYKDWDIIDDIPHEARLERYGLDFGYTNDPSAVVAIYFLNGGYILDEILYLHGMSNKQLADTILAQNPQVDDPMGAIAQTMLNSPQAMVVADSAEPKSIDEIKKYGINVVPAQKGKDSVEYGIQLVQGQRISITKRSINIIREYRNYLWETDRDGNIRTNPSVPDHQYSHSMDAIRYAMVSILSKPKLGKQVASETISPWYNDRDLPF